MQPFAHRSRATIALLAGLLLALGSVVVPLRILHAETFPWKSKFTKASSQDLASLHEAIHAPHLDSMRAYQVSNLTWSEQDYTLEMKSGTLYLEPPIDGATVGAFFEGTGVVHFAPSDVSARHSLEKHLARERLDGVTVATAYFFSLRADSPLAALSAAPGEPARPGSPDVYEGDKAALRQLGLDLTELFLDREGPARGTAYVLFPMQEIRGPRSEEARLLYSFVPIAQRGVTLSVFGHDEMTWMKPYKFRFYDLASYWVDNAAGNPDAQRYLVDLSFGTYANSTKEQVTIELTAPGVRVLRLDLDISMVVTGVRRGDSPLSFLQWKELNNDPDFDQTVLVSLGEPANGPLAVTVDSAGSAGSEDDWFPHIGYSDEALHELRLTIPKEYVGIGVGEMVEERIDGRFRTIVFRSTQPAMWSTFYYGDYTLTEGKADDITVELYQFRQNQRNAEFAVTEIANALKVFNRMFGPLDIKTLRVTSTPTFHGRGFEGLLLLGAGGTQSVESWADLFRAHEVAHQWWGNYVRILRWPQDRWIMESFAEYAAMEYYKIRFENHERAVEVMRDEWLDPLALGTIKYETLTGEKERLEGRTIQPIAAGKNNVYTKGPLVLHMLRYLFTLEKNDEAFFVMLRDFVAQYRYKAASTADFRAVAERHLGLDLGWFFEQWIEDGGLPVLKWTYTIAREGDRFLLTVNARQEQKAYRLDVPVYMRFSGDKSLVRPWRIEGEEGTFSIRLPMRPNRVSLNDNLESLIILKGGGEGG